MNPVTQHARAFLATSNIPGNWLELLLAGVLAGLVLGIPISLIAMVVMMRERDKRAARLAEPVEFENWWHGWWNDEPQVIDPHRLPIILGNEVGINEITQATTTTTTTTTAVEPLFWGFGGGLGRSSSSSSSGPSGGANAK